MPLCYKTPRLCNSGSSPQYRASGNAVDICSHGISLKAESETWETNTIRNNV